MLCLSYKNRIKKKIVADRSSLAEKSSCASLMIAQMCGGTRPVSCKWFPTISSKILATSTPLLI